MCAGMMTGKAWFKVPGALKFTLPASPNQWVKAASDDPAYHRMIGVDGALYQSMEFALRRVAVSSIDDRLCIANMAIEAGAKNGIFPVDDVTRAYCNGSRVRRWNTPTRMRYMKSEY